MKRAELDLICLDFDDLHRHAPAQAAAAALALLLDGPTCRARAVFLETLGARPRPAAFSHELSLIRGPGLARALAEGALDPTRLAALLRDPAGLLAAHAALADEEEPEPEPPATPGGFTDLLLTGRWPALKERLRPYLPAVLRFVGLSEAEADRALTFVLERALEAPPGGRFRDRLPDWLELFARRLGLPGLPVPLRPSDWLTVLDQGALHAVLTQEPPDEPGWARQFRHDALARPVRSWPDLDRLAPPPRAPAAFPAFRRDLLDRVRRERDRAAALFEV